VLLAVIGLVGWKTFRLWKDGPWDLPGPAKGRRGVVAGETQTAAKARPAMNTEVIISKNLFDPERGAGATREAEASSQAFQRIRSMILLGTAIIGNDRSAVLRDGANATRTPVAQGQSATAMLVKLGETVEGFRLSEITEQRVVFTKGASRVEVLLDYFRKPEIVETKTPVRRQAGTPRPVAPRVVPNLPRRDRLPIPTNPNPNR
jgi:hypothetical protein